MTYHLRERGLIESRGGGRARKYHLSAQIYRRMEQPDGYVRTHGIDPIQHEAMVLQYVKGHKKIVCNDVMRLCALNSDQATSLLRRMTKKRLAGTTRQSASLGILCPWHEST